MPADNKLANRFMTCIFLLYDTKVGLQGGTIGIQDTGLPTIFTGMGSGVLQGGELLLNLGYK
jgi:hypothetical protein